MTALECHFHDKIRFFDQVLKSEDRRVFVPTGDDLRAGSLVDVTLRVGDHPPVVAQAKVVAKRAKAGATQEAGVWLQFAQRQAESLRELLQISEGEGAALTSRTQPRFEASLPVLVDKPLRLPLRTKNLSSGGVCLSGVLPLPVGQTLRMTIEFHEQPVSIFGLVVWRRDDVHLTGVEFRFQSEQTKNQVRDHVQRLGDERSLMVFAKPTVLIVDDDLGTLRALERVLTHRGYGTLTATSGPEALSMAREHSPAMLLLDVLLPGMNGLEVCRALRRDVGTSRVPTVLTSVLPRESLAMLLEESGALVALLKPYRFEALAGLAQQVLDQSQSLIATPGAPSDARDQRHGRRVPLFERCIYESPTLRVETTLREASAQGAFLVSYWGDAIGTRAELTILSITDAPVRLEVEVVHRANWGVLDGVEPDRLPGLGLRFLAGTAQQEFASWLTSYQEALEDKPVIMLVDDDRAHLDMLRIMLRKHGCAVISIDSPFAVAHAVTLARPALVILDFMMPGLDGATLCRLIKSAPTSSNTPVWLYSSVSEAHLADLAREAGADGYVRKGERPSEIVDRVRAFLTTTAPPASAG